MTDVLAPERNRTGAEGKVSFYGVHHLALNTDDMKMTVDFYVGVLGMRLVHAMKVPPGLGTGPGTRGNPPFEEIRHYFFDMGRDGLLAFFEMPKGASRRATATRSAPCSTCRSPSRRKARRASARGSSSTRSPTTVRSRSCRASSRSTCSI